MDVKSKKRVGVLRGGTGDDYAFSLQKGGDIILHILENLDHKYKTFDILIDREGVWHLNGLPVMPADLIHKVDVVWNTAHPSLSILLDNLSIPNVGLDSFHSVFKNSREILQDHIKSIGVNLPRHVVLPVYQKDFDGPRERYATKKAKEVFEKFSSPWLIKSFTENSRMGVHLAKTFPELIHAIEDGTEHGVSILVEEFIVGKVASVHSLSGFRGENVYVFPVMNVFGELSVEEKSQLTQTIKDLHNKIDAKHYLKMTCTLGKRGEVYLIQIDSVPDFKLDSHYFSQVCDSVGAKTHHIIEHIIEKVL